MEVYLNVAEWGEGIFGAEAAARSDFGKSARSPTRGEAALLAAALPNPRMRDAGRPTARHRSLAGRGPRPQRGRRRERVPALRSLTRKGLASPGLSLYDRPLTEIEGKRAISGPAGARRPWRQPWPFRNELRR